MQTQIQRVIREERPKGFELDLEIRPIKGQREIEEMIALQGEVYGLSPGETMSPITLTALIQEFCRTGWVLGAFIKEEMVGFSIAFASARPGQIYGHMLGVLPRYRDNGIGNKLLTESFKLYREEGIRKVCWTYEPLEARNSHLYLNRLGACCVRYLENHYQVNSGPYRDIPLDRFFAELDLTKRPRRGPLPRHPKGEPYHYPLANGDDTPDAPVVLVEIPPDYGDLKVRDPASALSWRMKTRSLLKHYVNSKAMAVTSLLCKGAGRERRCFYLLEQLCR